ncbi:ABC transporter substrate-binding protein [Hwanghaeella grinnelliae]|uniref:ABC transporter substrate-binding protein n=1 Tax=Hwanghaeella grinnelliae TaxID=2500179 RepID=A0A437QXF4_9PROT|nr:ABC transporter substrate-binding protein [Hwanghaeella grinnelliae]RVU39194.1 ABC transporter substrate-binding protein [Hwanghaeella grinnelliae]
MNVSLNIPALLHPLRDGMALCFFTAILAFAAPGIVEAAEKTDQKEAAAFLQELGEEAIAVLADKEKPLHEREETVEGLLREHLELETMGRFVLGPEWRKASDDQRKAYVDLFSEFVVRTYSRRLGGYGGQQFEVTGTSQAGKTDALVITAITSNDGSPPIKAGWRVKTAANEKLKIVDVIVEGVSMLQTQRSEFDSVVRRSGLEGLMSLLQEKLDNLPKTSG